MMSKKQLVAMLCLHITYLLLGASIFYHIESPLEMEQRLDAKLERLEIQSLLHQHYLPAEPEGQFEILAKLSTYCGKPMYNYTEGDDPPIKWDFYHSFFFAYTVVSTIGYGNLAPTTSLGRILMIFYGLFGIPINGILLANLGEYFGITFVRIYRSYKSKHPNSESSFEHEVSRFGLCGEIVLYLLPGFLFFIFLPACLFVIFEGWDYVLAIYYAFVTLTTIGFGDYVAGTTDVGYGVYFEIYKVFLIVWITFGLGYIVMLLGFITRGMRSKKMMKIEHMLAENLKATHSKIWHGVSKDVGYLRRIINEAYLLKFKPVYSDDSPTVILHRSTSCPNLTFDREDLTKFVRKRRANSENISLSIVTGRIQSDTDLLGIDREKTFSANAMVQSADLLMKVVDALGNFRNDDESSDGEDEGIHGFSDEEILASERMEHGWMIGGEKIFADAPKVSRGRSFSVIGTPDTKKPYSQNGNEWSWVSSPATVKVQDIINRNNNIKKHKSLTSETIVSTEKLTAQPRNLLSKFKRSRLASIFAKSNKDDPSVELSHTPPLAKEYLAKTKRGRASLFTPAEKRYMDKTSSGRQSTWSMPSGHQSELLENTTVADLIRALAAIHSQDSDQPRRKMGTASLTPPRLPSIFNLFPQENEEATSSQAAAPKRRFSVRPVLGSARRPSLISTTESIFPAPSPRRRFSLLPTGTSDENKPFTPDIPPLLAASLDATSGRRMSLLSPPPYSSIVRNPSPSTNLFGGRRFSPPAPYQSGSLPSQARRYSLRPPTAAASGSGPIRRQVIRNRLRHESIVEVPSSANLNENEQRRNRINSLSDVKIVK